MHVKLKKKFGQNFLVDKNILNKIAKLIPYKVSSIIEIGPGNGSLTDYIIEKAPNKIVLIEIDPELINFLNEKYKNIKNIDIIQNDILKFDLKKFNKEDIIISNLPYNISSQILVKINNCNYFQKFILMFQKEFADRLIASKLNNLNCLIKCFYEINKEFQVSNNSFYPPPKVQSTVLTFIKKEKSLIVDGDLILYSKFKSMIFINKRKKISTILKKNFIEYNESEFYNVRAEELNLEVFVKIFIELRPQLINKFS